MKTICLVLLVLISTASSATTLVYNANGYSLDKHGKLFLFTDLVIEQGKVVATGNGLGKNYPLAYKINANGKTLLPGLIDAHGHLLGLGTVLLEVDVRDITSAQETARKVQHYSKQHPNLPWITGRGWNQVLWNNKAFPHTSQLDEYIKNRPVWLARVDGHAGWANSLALKIAGINKDTLDPPGGSIVRDEQGMPTGVLIDNAMQLLEKHIPKADKKSLEARLSAAGAHLLSLGITSMHDAGIDKATYDLYREKSSALPLRVYAMLSATDPSLAQMLKQGHIDDTNDMLSIRSVKVYGDGALGSRGAALLHDYDDDQGNSGLLLTKLKHLPILFKTVIGANFQLNYHAIGDRANQLALDTFASTFDALGGQNLRHRVEHAQVISLNDIPRFKTLDIIPSMQPTHATSDMNMAPKRIGEQRLKGAYAWQTFIQQGSPVAFGSDFPVELANPFYGLHASVTRQNRQNKPVNGWLPHESVTINQALKGFTLDAAYAAHQEEKLGTLEPGKWADFILLDKDIFRIPSHDIWKTKVIATYIAGQKKYQAEP